MPYDRIGRFCKKKIEQTRTLIETIEKQSGT